MAWAPSHFCDKLAPISKLWDASNDKQILTKVGLLMDLELNLFKFSLFFLICIKLKLRLFLNRIFQTNIVWNFIFFDVNFLQFFHNLDLLQRNIRRVQSILTHENIIFINFIPFILVKN